MSLVHILALSLFVALCYAQNEFWYSEADVVYAHYVVFPFLVYEKAYACLAVVCLRMVWPLCKVMKHSSDLLTSPFPITSHTNVVSLSSSSSSCMYSSLSRILTL